MQILIVFFSKRGLQWMAFAITTILIVAVMLYVSKPFLNKKISEAIGKQVPDGYQLAYGSIDISYFPFGAEFKKIKLFSEYPIPDSMDHKLGIIDVRIEKLNINKIGLWNYFFHNHLQIQQIMVNGVEINWKGSLLKEEAKDTVLSNSLKHIQVDTISITNISLQYHDELSDTMPSFIAPIVNVAFHNSRLDLHTLTYNSDHYQMELIKPFYRQKSGLHSIEADRLFFSSINSSLSVDSLRMKPLIRVSQLSGMVDQKTDIMDLVIPNSKVVGFDVDQWIASERFVADKIELNRPRLEVFSDKTLPPKIHITGMPSEMLSKIDNLFKVDSISINKGFIKYYELKHNKNAPGHLTFENINAVVKGISNQKDSLGRSSIKASAYFMGSGLLKADIVFPLGFQTDTFTIKGSLGSMELDRLNSMIVHAASVEITNGISESMEFNFQANGHFSSGNLCFHYNDLKLTFLDKEQNKRGILKQIVSTITNMAVYNSNPKNRKLREGEIFFVRDEPKSIFNYWWKSLQSGIESSILVKNNKNN